MKNLFLTGEVGVGKSTVISKTLALLPPLVCGGFRTVSDASCTEGARFDVFIEEVWEQTPHDDAHRVGIRSGTGCMTPYPAVFDNIGASILAFPPEGAELILMDELGVMERGAKEFCMAVLKVLDGNIPVLGVIKPKHTAFLDTVRSHERSVLFEVTEENRDCLPSSLAELLLEELRSGE